MTEVSGKTPLTLDQKIEQAEARLAKLRQQKLTEDLLTNIERGDAVTIKFGRGDKVRRVTGEVVGVALPSIVVLDGVDTYKVHVRDVISNPDAAARTKEGPDVSEIGSDGRRPEEAGSNEVNESRLGASEDPLENA